MALSKKLRFEIFKRDLFHCQYCGRRPPAVMLEIDHVIPRANGGCDDSANLITSCFDCNRGKGAKNLDEIPPANKVELQRKIELRAQLDALNTFLESERKRQTRNVKALEKQWGEVFECVGLRMCVTQNERAKSFRIFMKRLPLAEIKEAMVIAHDKKPVLHHDGDTPTWKYFCGVCWSKIRGDER